VATGDTKALIEAGVRRFGEEVPSLEKLRLVMRLELRARRDLQTWRVELPGPVLSRDPARDAVVTVAMDRSHLAALASKGRLAQWIEAYNQGHIHVSGAREVTMLVARVIERQQQRAPARRRP